MKPELLHILMTCLLRRSSLFLLLAAVVAPFTNGTAVLGLPPQSQLIPSRPTVPASEETRLSLSPLPLSPGDQLRIMIPGVGGEMFSGDYEVNLNGELEIPLLLPLPVAGLVPQQVQSLLAAELLQRQYFRPDLLQVSVQVLEYAPIQITVAGATFKPGRILLSQATEGVVQQDGQTAQVPGDYPLERYLTSALLSAGGVKPTADLSKIQVVRNGQAIAVDLTGIFAGEPIEDVPLIAGDQVLVPDIGYFQANLVRPSQITPAEVPLYISNLTRPGGASLEGADSINTTTFEYGTRLGQILVASECVGGTRTTNANRRAVLIQTNSSTGEATASEYAVERVVRQSNTEENINPFLMPYDAIACYDSDVIGIEGILGILGSFFAPINFVNQILE